MRARKRARRAARPTRECAASAWGLPSASDEIAGRADRRSGRARNRTSTTVIARPRQPTVANGIVATVTPIRRNTSELAMKAANSQKAMTNSRPSGGKPSFSPRLQHARDCPSAARPRRSPARPRRGIVRPAGTSHRRQPTVSAVSTRWSVVRPASAIAARRADQPHQNAAAGHEDQSPRSDRGCGAVPVACAQARTSVNSTAATPSLNRLSLSTSSRRRPLTPVSLNMAMTATGSVAAIRAPNTRADDIGQPRSCSFPPPRRRPRRRRPASRAENRQAVPAQFAASGC